LIRLAEADVEAIARRVAELLREHRLETVSLVDASEAAALLGVERGFVYRHADRLRAIRVGDGPRPRLRFDPRVLAGLASARAEHKESAPPQPVSRRRSESARPGLTAAGNPLLPDPNSNHNDGVV
jgi:hypothetical protein